MKVVEIPRAGPPDVLAVRERPSPSPKPGEVVIDVRAAGVNFADIHARMGIYPDAPPFPFVPGYEVAGVERGTGRRVLAATRFGGYAAEVAVPSSHAFEIPDGLSFEEAAAIPVNYLTAWVALMEMSRLRAGEVVVVHSGAGGVGIAAAQIALRHGGRVFGVVGSAEKAAYLKSIGVEPVVRPATPPPADVILDPRGPSAWKQSLKGLKQGGRVVLYGAQEFVTGKRRNVFKAGWKLLTMPKLNPIDLMNENKGVFGLNMLHLGREEEAMRRAFEAVLAGVREGWLKPRVDKAFPFDRAAAAHHYLQDRRNIGKVVLIP